MKEIILVALLGAVCVFLISMCYVLFPLLILATVIEAWWG